MKVYACSDVHTDYKPNLAWVQHISTLETFKSDIIILAGDISDDLEVLRTTLECFISAFAHTFFTVGNHELWVRRLERGQYDSIGKLTKILELCTELGVKTTPERIEGVWIVPLWSWYHASWDKEPDVPGAMPIEKVMLDYHVCSWTSVPGISSSDDSLAQYMDSLNDDPIYTNNTPFPATLKAIQAERMANKASGLPPPFIVSFSHFLPDQRLLPEKRWLHFPNLAKASGSNYLAQRLEKLKPSAHIYGHTHFKQDYVLEDVRYVQWPLGYPHERKRHGQKEECLEWRPLELFDTEGLVEGRQRQSITERMKGVLIL